VSTGTRVTRHVKYMDLPRQFESGAISRKVAEEFERCQFVLGPQVSTFEARFARLCGTRYAIGVNSGTDALFLSLRALGIGPGDEVITAPNSFVATAGAIISAGATVVFADVTADYTIDPQQAEVAVTSRTRAIVPVHLTGTPADMGAIAAMAARRGLAVVEDGAQAVGAAIHGRPVGSLGEVGCFSLFPLKNLGVAGDGGMVTTDSPDLDRAIRLLRNHGLRNRDECEMFGYNSRLDTIQAIVGDALLDSIDRVSSSRLAHAAFYDQALAHLAPDVQVPPRRPGIRQVFHTYVVQVARRAELIAHLAERGIETKIHYPIPIHLQPAAANLGYKRGAFPVAEAQADRILSLPVHEYLTAEDLAYVAETVQEFYRG
jgi:dTDP-4-amino-4,6-dideoxygalactose transaminase